MIRQRFNPGRLSRIGAWALAAVTSVAAILNNQSASAETETAPPPDSSPPIDRFSTTVAQIPAPPADGLLVLRFEPTPSPPPPTIVRRTIIEERVVGSTASPAAPAGSSPTPSQPATATPAPPPPPAPAPAPLPAAPPVQSSGS